MKNDLIKRANEAAKEEAQKTNKVREMSTLAQFNFEDDAIKNWVVGGFDKFIEAKLITLGFDSIDVLKIKYAELV